jgi:imidazolonepropionase-like amidohydrolase
VFHSREYPPERLLAYETIADRLALSGRGWATIDWDATQAIIDAMLDAKVVYCGMQVITQYQLNEGVAELSADPQFNALFSAADRARFLAFIDRIQGTWSNEDFAQWRIANDNRMEWMRRFRAGGGVLVFGTDMQFGGIMLHRELANALTLGMMPLEVIAAATGGTARALGLDAEIGTIRPGRCADLVVLNRDPSADLTALRDVDCVFREGRLLWRDALASHQSE